jgi:hypothetical protein
MNTNLDHHGVEFTSRGDVERPDVGLNDTLHFVVRRFEHVNRVCVYTGARQESPSVGIDDKEWMLPTVEHDGIGAFAANLWERQEHLAAFGAGECQNRLKLIG